MRPDWILDEPEPDASLLRLLLFRPCLREWDFDDRGASASAVACSSEGGIWTHLVLSPVSRFNRRGARKGVSMVCYVKSGNEVNEVDKRRHG